MKIALDLHNLSVRTDKFVRTGIQQVLFKLLLAQYQMREELKKGNVEIIPLPWLPTTIPSESSHFDRIQPYHINNSKRILQECAQELDVPLNLLWNNQTDNDVFQFSENDFYRVVSDCDWLVVPASCELRHVVPKLKRLNPKLKCANLVHDLVCLLFPELTDSGHYLWFRESVIGSLTSVVDVIFTNSFHTGIDCMQLLDDTLPNKTKIISVLLPGEDKLFCKDNSILDKFNVKKKKYLISIGTLEPRKNLGLALKAFLKLIHQFPEEFKDYRYIVAGKMGWGGMEQELRNELQTCSQIIFTGYLTALELQAMLENSCGLIMPSRYEGYGLPLSFAKKNHLPVLTCTNSSLPEIALFDNSIYTYPFGLDSMMMGMIELFSLQSLSLKQDDLRQNTYNWNHFLKNWVTELQDFNSQEVDYGK